MLHVRATAERCFWSDTELLKDLHLLRFNVLSHVSAENWMAPTLPNILMRKRNRFLRAAASRWCGRSVKLIRGGESGE